MLQLVSTYQRCSIEDSHWVDSPEDESESGNSTVESFGLAILAGNCRSTVEGKLVDDDQECKAGPGVPSPLLAVAVAVGSKETGKDHDEICNNGNENVGTAEASEQSKIEKQEWGRDAPVDITCPVDLTVGYLDCVWNMLVALDLHNLVVALSISSGHGKVGQEGKGGDESSQNMEESFLLPMLACI